VHRVFRCFFAIHGSAHRILLATSTILLGSVQVAHAQDSGARLQNLQREIDQRNNISPALPTPEKKEKSAIVKEADTQKILVKSFKITGLSLISDEVAQSAIASMRNQELSFLQLKEVGQQVADLYAAIGRLAIAVIPEQDVEDGVIEIRIIEARVGSIFISPAKDGKLLHIEERVANGFISKGNAAGQFLNLDQLNRSKALINELPGVSAEVALSKSQTDGRSDIQVFLEESPMVAARVDASNTGSASTGEIQTALSLNINNPRRVGDAVNIDAIRSEGSSFVTLKYWVPAGYDGLRIAPGVSALNYRSLSNFSSTISNGNAHVAGFYLTYPWIRDAGNVRSINLSAEIKDYQNFSNDIQSSAYGIKKLNAGISGYWIGEKQSISYGINFGLGNLIIKNSTQLLNDQSQTGSQTTGDFSKLNLNLTFNSDLPIAKTTARLVMSGQLASKNLNSSEQMYLGGLDGVRAYPVAQGGGSQGLLASVEITHNYPNQLQLGAFVDMGIIQQYKLNWSSALQGNTQADNTYSLSAIGLLAKYAWQNFQLQSAMAFRIGDNPLRSSTGAQLNTDNRYNSVQVWLRGTYFFN
jgi:hemolysin activation/secretion protein